MNANEVRQMSDEQLNQKLIDLHREQFNLKMQKATGQLAKPDLIKKNRRTIARINTVLAEKEAKV